jgi:molybdopterin/thiamine biosynthesis adenylyltransferase
MNTVYLIGAGGVASYLLPVLIKTFRPKKIILQDKDTLETRNLDRQLFRPSDVGSNKAQALGKLHYSLTCTIEVVEDWFTEATEIPEDVDFIICMADNHEARRAALNAADMHRKMVIIGGNEYFDNEAYLYAHSMANTLADPRVRHPEILTNNEGSPINCQGDAQIATPQLALANMGCAHKILSLLWVHTQVFNDISKEVGFGEALQQIVKTLPITIEQSITQTTTLSFNDYTE